MGRALKDERSNSTERHEGVILQHYNVPPHAAKLDGNVEMGNPTAAAVVIRYYSI